MKCHSSMAYLCERLYGCVGKKPKRPNGKNCSVVGLLVVLKRWAY